MNIYKVEMVGRASGNHILCDADDFPILSRHRWNLDGKGNYPVSKIYVSGGKDKNISIINVLGIEIPDGMELDHRNRNKLDWRRENLRICTHSQNNMNKEKYKDNGTLYKGIYFQRGRWKVQIVKNKKMYVLGTFDDEIYAAHIYDAGAKHLHGDFAVLNFPNDNWFPNFDFDEHRKLVSKRIRKENIYEYSRF
jgi:hypothetical protein